MTRAQQSERTKIKLMNATRDIVVEKGWSGATSRAVANRAGVNPALISFHFGGKTSLLRATLDRCHAAVNARFGPLNAAGSLAGLVKICVESAPFISTDVNARFLLSAMLEGARNEGFGEVVKGQLDLFKAGVEEAVRNEPLPATKKEQVVDLIAAAMDGLMIHLVLDPSTNMAGAIELLGEALESLLHKQDADVRPSDFSTQRRRGAEK